MIWIAFNILAQELKMSWPLSSMNGRQNVPRKRIREHERILMDRGFERTRAKLAAYHIDDCTSDAHILIKLGTY